MVTGKSEICPMKGDGYCPRKLESIGIFRSKWSLPILITIGNFEKLRFNQLRGKINGISAKVLSENLHKLEYCQLISRDVFSETLLHVEYKLASRGREIYNSLSIIAESGGLWRKKS